MRDYLEEQGYDLQSYVNELLRNIKDDLFEVVGIEYEDIDAAMEQVLSAACQKVQKVPKNYRFSE